MTDSHKSDRSRHLAILGVLLGASVSLNVVQHTRVRGADAAMTALRKSVNTSQVAMNLIVGDTAPPIDGVGLNGEPATVHFGSAALPTVVYVFTPQCHFCVVNEPNFTTLAREAGKAYRVVGVSLRRQELEVHIAKNDYRFLVVTDPTRKTIQQYGFGATPTTLLIDRDGRLSRIWRGAYSAATQAEIEKELGVSLPGLAPTSGG